MVSTALEPGVDVCPDCLHAVNSTALLLAGLGHEIEEIDPATLGLEALFDPLLVRWSAGQAARLAQLSILLGRAVTAADVEPLTWALAQRGASHSAADYLRAVAKHQQISRAVAGLHADGIDLLLTPTLPSLPPELGSFDDSGAEPLDALAPARALGTFTCLFNVTGQPAISLPLEMSESGLPVGLQLAAAFGREDLLIRISAQLERAAPWHDRIPPVFAEDRREPRIEATARDLL